ncbi:hypothetical protein, partial [Paraburkholderia fungorum]|uniref:hypothetical protein n=1 Tax=Paraburkholderia fungorum TaxID=134537 RepID=UPI001C3F42DC
TPEQTTTTTRKTKAAPPNKPGTAKQTRHRQTNPAPPNKPGTAKQNQPLNNPKPFPSIMSAILTRGAS